MERTNGTDARRCKKEGAEAEGEDLDDRSRKVSRGAVVGRRHLFSVGLYGVGTPGRSRVHATSEKGEGQRPVLHQPGHQLYIFR